MLHSNECSIYIFLNIEHFPSLIICWIIRRNRQKLSTQRMKEGPSLLALKKLKKDYKWILWTTYANILVNLDKRGQIPGNIYNSQTWLKKKHKVWIDLWHVKEWIDNKVCLWVTLPKNGREGDSKSPSLQ